MHRILTRKSHFPSQCGWYPSAIDDAPVIAAHYRIETDVESLEYLCKTGARAAKKFPLKKVLGQTRHLQKNAPPRWENLLDIPGKRHVPFSGCCQSSVQRQVFLFLMVVFAFQNLRVLCSFVFECASFQFAHEQSFMQFQDFWVCTTWTR